MNPFNFFASVEYIERMLDSGETKEGCVTCVGMIAVWGLIVVWFVFILWLFGRIFFS